MTPERWRAVDAIIQSALEYDRDARNAFVAGACREDLALQREVVSLLAAHDAAPLDFLERPAFEELAVSHSLEAPPAPGDAPPARPSSDAPTGRMVSAQALVYVAAAVLLVGVIGGWGMAHLSFSAPWNRSSVSAQAAAPAVTVEAPAGSTDGLSLVVVDRSGRVLHVIPADRPWTPRLSPDGSRVAYGAFGTGRQTSDLWVTRLDDWSTRRITDDDGDSNDPTWSPDGSALAYSASADGGKDVFARPLGDGTPHVVASRPGTQFPSDWRRDGSALLVTEEPGNGNGDVLVQPDDGAAARPYSATGAAETSARFSPDGRWVAYTSEESGRPEVYIDSYAAPAQRVLVSRGGGVDPVWRADGKELYYWRDDQLVAVRLDPGAGNRAPAPDGESVLFRAPYQRSINTMYDASSDGQRFVVVVHR